MPRTLDTSNDPIVPFHSHHNTGHWALTIVVTIVAIVACVNSFNLSKRVAGLEQKVSAKADTTMVNAELDARDVLHQQDMVVINQRLEATEDNITSTRDYAGEVHKSLDDLDANVMGLRKRLGYVEAQQPSLITQQQVEGMINQAVDPLVKVQSLTLQATGYTMGAVDQLIPWVKELQTQNDQLQRRVKGSP